MAVLFTQTYTEELSGIGMMADTGTLVHREITDIPFETFGTGTLTITITCEAKQTGGGPIQAFIGEPGVDEFSYPSAPISAITATAGASYAAATFDGPAYGSFPGAGDQTFTGSGVPQSVYFYGSVDLDTFATTTGWVRNFTITIEGDAPAPPAPTVRSAAEYITDTTLYRPFYYLKITGLPYYFFSVIDPTDSQYGVSAWTLADGYSAIQGMRVPVSHFEQSLKDIVGGIASAERVTLDLTDFKVVDANGSHAFFGRLLAPGRFTTNLSSVIGNLAADIGPTDTGEVLMVDPLNPAGGAFAEDADTYIGGETVGISTVTPGAGIRQQIYITDRNKYPCHSGYPATPFYRVQTDPAGTYNPLTAGFVTQGGPLTFIGRSAALYIGHLLPDGRPEPEASSLCRLIGHVKSVTSGRDPGIYSIEIESVMADLNDAKIAPQLAHAEMLPSIYLPTAKDCTLHYGVRYTTSGGSFGEATKVVSIPAGAYRNAIEIQIALNLAFTAAGPLQLGTGHTNDYFFYCSPSKVNGEAFFSFTAHSPTTVPSGGNIQAWVGQYIPDATATTPATDIEQASGVILALGFMTGKTSSSPANSLAPVSIQGDRPLPSLFIPGDNTATAVLLSSGSDANGQRFFTDQGDGSGVAYVRFSTGQIGRITASTTSSLTLLGVGGGASLGGGSRGGVTFASGPLYLGPTDALTVDQVIHIAPSKGAFGPSGDDLLPRLLASKGYSGDGEYNVFPVGVGLGLDGILDKSSFRKMPALLGPGTIAVDIDSTMKFMDLWMGYAKARGLFLVWDPETEQITCRQIGLANFADANAFTFSESNRVSEKDRSESKTDFSNLRMSWTFKYGWDAIENKFSAAAITVNDPFAMQAYQQALRSEVIEDRLIPSSRPGAMGDVIAAFVPRLRYTQQPWAKITRTVNKRGLLLSPGRYHKIVDATLVNPFTGVLGIDSDDELYGWLHSVSSNLSDGSVRVTFLIDQTTDQTTLRPYSPTGLLSFAAASNGYNNATGVCTMDDRFRSSTTGGEFDGVDFKVGDKVYLITYDNNGAPGYTKAGTVSAVATNGSTVTITSGLGAVSSSVETIMVLQDWADATSARKTGASRVAFQGDGDDLLIDGTDRLHKWS